VGDQGEASVDRRIPLRWLLGPFAVFAAASVVADWTWPALVSDHPLLLLTMSAKNRFLLLTAPQLGMATYFTVAFVRLVASDPLTFLLGRHHGADAVAWFESRSNAKAGKETLIRRVERYFDRAGPVVIFVAPSALWCVLAGAARMKVWVFVACNLSGTLIRLILFWFAADALRDELDGVLETIDDIQVPLVVVTIALGALHVARQRRKVTEAAVVADLEGDAGLALVDDLTDG
jgi:membrane protein DedA with SNARE-associated domain